MQQAAKAAKEGLSGLGSLLDSVATKLTIRQDSSGQGGPSQHQQHPLQATPLASLMAVASGGSRANSIGAAADSAAAHSQQQQQQQQQYPAPARPTVPIEARISRFKQELLASRINLPELRRLAYQGIPDRDGLRALTWKLLLGYLPPDPSEWDEVLARKRTEYFLFCEDLIVDPKKAELEQQQQQAGSAAPADGASCSGSSSGGGAAGSSSKHAAATSSSITSSSSSAAAAAGPPLDPLSSGGGCSSSGGGSMQQQHDPLSQPSKELKGELPGDHPLSLNSTSKWHTYFKDNEIMEQIERDVLRTHPDMHFFSGDTPDAEQHRREMQRCLFMYAKLNPGLRYIQGMNELLAPLYHAFACDVDATAARYAEADAFYCFVDLISEFRDHFCQQLDNSSSGIKATIGKLVALLQAHDPQLAAHLQAHKVDPQFFAFRWITLLLTQEFPFPDAVRIWDTLLSDAGGRPDCLMRVCVAMLLHVRQTLLEGDFAVIVKTLQRLPSVDVDVILRAAARLPPCESVLGAPL